MELPKLEAFQIGDGAHCGLSDWYPEKEAALKAALEAGKPFDTGWYSSKKEIASARIYSVDGEHILVEASVSDDFDTPGTGSAMVTEGGEVKSLKGVAEAIQRAWNEAEGNQKDNRQYIGWALYHRTNDRPRQRKWWKCMDYLILPMGDGYEFSGPPGDNYHYWGWQNDYREGDDENSGKKCVEAGIPPATAEKLRAWAEDSMNETPLSIGDWEIRPWNDD